MNKKHTYILFLCIWLCIGNVFAQVDSSQLKLKDLEAVEITGSTKILFDPALRPRSDFFVGQYSLGQALQQQNVVFLKSYGPGLLSSISARGTSPAHTPILWNGFSLQNAVNANPDPSVENLPQFYRAGYYAGGQSGLYGSGAMGGTIHLSQSFIQPKGIYADAGLVVGSFGLNSQSFNIGYNTDSTKMTAGLKLFSAKNNFTFINRALLTKPVQRLEHAEASGTSLNIDFKHIFKKFGTISAAIWYQFNRRQIPPTMIASVGNPEQTDENVRSMVAWTKSIKGKHNLSIKTAFLYDYLFYDDVSLTIPSLMVQYASLTRAEYDFRFYRNHFILAGLNHTYYKVFMEEYQGIAPKRNQSTLFLGYKYRLPKGIGEISVQAVEELTDGKLTPFCPSFSALIKPLKALPIRVRINRNYRQPTFNDLYWTPGGNINLKPELGFAQELGIGYETKTAYYDWSSSGMSVSFFATGFHNLITNRIVWVPGPVYWAPENIDKTRAYGAEADLKIEWKKKKWGINFTGNYSFTRSVRAEERFENDPTFNKQLIYIPEHLAGAVLSFSYKKTSLFYRHSYTGKRYTLADNSAAIAAFNIGSVGISQSVKFFGLTGSISFSCENIANTSYEVLEYRPMPGRNYRVGINLSFNKQIPK